MAEDLKLINMEQVAVEKINWLWYPYIPFGKITIVQGDPGDGKTTMILAIAAAATQGALLPECSVPVGPFNVIYQTAEDGLGDTIKPRLVQAGADCNRVLVIDESQRELTLCDARIEQAITQTEAKLFILDPLQAYLGADVDMHRANEVRPVFKKFGDVARRTGCAMVIIGHMNKGCGKSQYRGLGSIDFQAAARSVLTVGRIQGNPYLRAFAQGKSNLAPEGASIAFELVPDKPFRWVGKHDVTVDMLMNGYQDTRSVYDRAESLINDLLSSGPVSATEIYEAAKEHGISPRTLNKAKSNLGVGSCKDGNQWFWTPADGG